MDLGGGRGLREQPGHAPAQVLLGPDDVLALVKQRREVAAMPAPGRVSVCDEDRSEPSRRCAGSFADLHELREMAVDDASFLAIHTGLFRVGARGATPERVAGRYQDTMGFTVLGPDHFLGVYGYDARGSRLMVSTGGGRTWPTRHRTKYLEDFVVSPADPRLLIASTESGVIRSEDLGRTWAPARGPLRGVFPGRGTTNCTSSGAAAPVGAALTAAAAGRRPDGWRRAGGLDGVRRGPPRRGHPRSRGNEVR